MVYGLNDSSSMCAGHWEGRGRGGVCRCVGFQPYKQRAAGAYQSLRALGMRACSLHAAMVSPSPAWELVVSLQKVRFALAHSPQPGAAWADRPLSVAIVSVLRRCHRLSDTRDGVLAPTLHPVKAAAGVYVRW